MKHQKNTYAHREMRRRRMEAERRLKRRVCDFVGRTALVFCVEAFFVTVLLL